MERILLSLIIGAASMALLQKSKEYNRVYDLKNQNIPKHNNIEVTKTVGSQFREIRAFHQLSAAELGSKIGLSEANILSIENDKAVPSRDILFLMEDMFHTTIRTDIRVQP
jgi:DNA-binding XRE family transcriptional regulator